MHCIGAIALGVAALAACGEGRAQEYQSDAHRFRVTTVARGLAHPWGLAFLPEGGLLVTERPGRLQLVRDGIVTEVSGTPEVRARGQGGLLDVEIHPRFDENGLVYLTYSKPGRGGATTALARARLEGTALHDLEDVFVAEAWTGAGVHFGSRIVFDRDGMVYLSIGDRGQMDQAQNRSNHQGAVVRLHDDGRVPQDNPYVGRPGYRPEIWSFGHRSPQGMTLHPLTGELWENEHGPRGGDEVNLIRRGRNYGWPRITFGIDYSGTIISPDTAHPRMEQPLLYWVPSIAVSGMTIYHGDAFPRWEGNVFVGALAGQHLRRIVFEGDRATHQEVLLDDLDVRIRQVKTGPDGLLYVLTDEDDGAVLRLEPLD